MKTSLRCNQSAELQCLSPDAYQGHKQERLLLLTSLLVTTQPRPAPWLSPMGRRLVRWESPPWPSYTGPHPEPGCGSPRRPWSQHSQQGTPHPPCDSAPHVHASAPVLIAPTSTRDTQSRVLKTLGAWSSSRSPGLYTLFQAPLPNTSVSAFFSPWQREEVLPTGGTRQLPVLSTPLADHAPRAGGVRSTRHVQHVASAGAQMALNKRLNDGEEEDRAEP